MRDSRGECGLLWEGVVTYIHKMETAPTVAALETTRNTARLFHVADRLTPRRINLWASRLLGRLEADAPLSVLNL
jgi:hypothetical protein